MDSITINKHENTVKAVVNRLLLSRNLSSLPIEREDLYQIGWIALINCLKHYKKDGGAAFERYATVAIINEVNRELQKLSNKTFNAEPIIEDELFAEETTEELMKQFIDSVQNNINITREEKTIFWMRFLEQLSFSEIGKLMGYSREKARQIYNETEKKVKEIVTYEF